MRFGRSDTPFENRLTTDECSFHNAVELPAQERRILAATDKMGEGLFGLRIDDHDVGVGAGLKCSAGKFKNSRREIRHSKNHVFERKKSGLNQFSDDERKRSFEPNQPKGCGVKLL